MRLLARTALLIALIASATGLTFATASADNEVIIGSPENGATYHVGQEVGVFFSCNDSTSGPNTTTCVAGNGSEGTTLNPTYSDGSLLNTSTTGLFAFTVDADFADGSHHFMTVLYAIDDPDGDGDGTVDRLDNCRKIANADQSNADGDAYGDACDGRMQGEGKTKLDDGTPVKFELNSDCGTGPHQTLHVKWGDEKLQAPTNGYCSDSDSVENGKAGFDTWQGGFVAQSSQGEDVNISMTCTDMPGKSDVCYVDAMFMSSPDPQSAQIPSKNLKAKPAKV